jgi:glycosyltransferase involved in cell wall biosynthesis
VRIGMVLDKPYPPDIRVEKEARALLGAGFEVGLLAMSAGDNPQRETTSYGLYLFRTAVPRDSMWARQLKGFSLLKKGWLEPLNRFVSEFRPDILHVHDFPMVKTVLRVAEPRGLPVVADLHENMPAALRAWRAGLDPVRRAKDALVRNYYLWRAFERQLLARCARVIVVVPEAAEWPLRYGLDPARIVVVSNTEDESTFDIGSIAQDVIDKYKPYWVASYVGGVGPHRGLDTAIRAAPLAAAHIPTFRLVIVGAKDDRQAKPLRRLIDNLGVDDQVEIVGWQPPDRVNSYIAASAVCLVPHNDSEHTQTTIPHKLFQYMLAGKPVVVSNVRPLERVVQQTGAGLVFPAEDPSALAKALVKLYREPNLQQELGRNGQKAARTLFSWRNDAGRLVNLYRDLAGGGE